MLSKNVYYKDHWIVHELHVKTQLSYLLKYETMYTCIKRVPLHVKHDNGVTYLKIIQLLHGGNESLWCSSSLPSVQTLRSIVSFPRNIPSKCTDSMSMAPGFVLCLEK